MISNSSALRSIMQYALYVMMFLIASCATNSDDDRPVVAPIQDPIQAPASSINERLVAKASEVSAELAMHGVAFACFKIEKQRWPKNFAEMAAFLPNTEHCGSLINQQEAAQFWHRFPTAQITSVTTSEAKIVISEQLIDGDLKILNPRLTINYKIDYSSKILSEGNPRHPARVSNAWIRAMPPGAKSTAGYFDIKNSGDKALVLIAVRHPDFDDVSLHRSFNQNGMTKMEHLESLAIQPHSQVHFAPGGYHLMMMGARQALAIGDESKLRFQFSGQADLEVQTLVKMSE